MLYRYNNSHNCWCLSNKILYFFFQNHSIALRSSLFFYFLAICPLVSLRLPTWSCSKIWHMAPSEQMDHIENFRKAGTGGVRNHVRSFFVWFLGLLDLLARSWCVSREHMIMFLGRVRKEGIFFSDPVGISRKTKKASEKKKKRARGRQKVSEIRKHRLLRQQYRICPVTSSNMCVQPLPATVRRCHSRHIFILQLTYPVFISVYKLIYFPEARKWFNSLIIKLYNQWYFNDVSRFSIFIFLYLSQIRLRLSNFSSTFIY